MNHNLRLGWVGGTLLPIKATQDKVHDFSFCINIIIITYHIMMLTRAITISLNSVKNCTSSCALSLCLDRTIPNPMQKQISPIIKNKEQQCDGLQESTYICRMSYILCWKRILEYIIAFWEKLGSTMGLFARGSLSTKCHMHISQDNWDSEGFHKGIRVL